MKKLLFGLIATIMFGFVGNAQSENNFSQKSEFKSASFTTKFNNETVNYYFKTLNEFNEGTEGVFQSFDFQNSEAGKLLGDKCEVTITVIIEVSIGVATGTMSGSVTTTCADADAAARRLKAMLLSAAMEG